MSVNEIGGLIFENYYKQTAFAKERSYYSMKPLKKKDLLLLANKLIEKIFDPGNSKENYQSFVRKKSTNTEIITD